MSTEQFVLDATICTEIINLLSEKLKGYYVYPDIADQICTCLDQHLINGDYADISEGDLFALALTMHLQEVNHDEHLWVRWHQEPLPDDDEPLRCNRAWQEERRLEAQLDNFGFHKVERMPGNIGYIDIRYFYRAAWGGDTVTAAMNFLVNAGALIIDLRECTGGYPAMISLISSYFFGEEPIQVSSIYWRDEDITQQYWTLPYIPGRRFGDIPVYVLTSKNTFSGGEEFASILQTRKRAIVIGEKTDGGANPGTSYRIHPHYEVFIPIGNAVNPVTGKSLEGVGVTPDISVPKEKVLPVAYQLALKAVMANLGECGSEPYKRLAEEVQTALRDLESSQGPFPDK